MAPPKRRASIVAEAMNKRIAEEAEAFKGTSRSGIGSNESSPLTSVMGETPSPPAGLGLERKGVGGSLVQQIQRVKREGLEVRAGEGGFADSGNHTGLDNTASAKTSCDWNSATGGSGKNAGSTPKKAMATEGMLPPRTPTNKGENEAVGGSIQQKPKVKKALLLPTTPANGGGSGSIQKRSSSVYLENAPDSLEQDREHERPVKRQWRIAMPPPFQTPPMMSQNQKKLRKILGDSDLLALTGPSYTGDPNHADLSNLLWAEIHMKNEPPKLELFPGLPQYPVSRPGPQNAAYAPRERASTDSLGTATKHLKMLDDLKKEGFLMSQERAESHRLHAQFVRLMRDQRRDMFIKNNRPIDTEDYIRRQPPTPEIKNLALGKLKPARNRADPALFGTWHNPKPMHEEDSQGCTFCMFDCDYGVSDERVWLPIEASGGFCRACHEATMDSYHEVEHILDAEVVGELGRDVQQRLDGLRIAAATPPLKELGDKMKFKEVATVFVSERTKPSDSPQTPGGIDGIRNMGAQQKQQVTRSFNGASTSRSPSPLRNITPASPRVSMSGFAGLSPQKQQQFMMANTGRGVPSQDSLPEAWDALVSELGPQQRQFMLMHLNGGSRVQVSQIMQGGDGSPPLQNSMLNGGAAVDLSFQRCLPNVQMVPASSQAVFRGKEAPNALMDRAANRPDKSPLMQSVMSNGDQHIPSSQRRLSNDKTPRPSSQRSVNGNRAPNTEVASQIINFGPGGSPLIQFSMQNGENTPIQKRLPNVSNPPSSQMSVNDNETANAENNQQRARAMNGPSGSPLMQPSMLIEAHNLCQRERRLSNNSSTPVHLVLSSNEPQNFQRNGGAMIIPGGSPLMHVSTLKGAGTPHQRRLSNGINPRTLSPISPKSNSVPNSQQNERPNDAVGGVSAALPRTRNGARSPLIEGPMLSGTANAKKLNRRRLSNSVSRPEPPQITSNFNGALKAQKFPLVNAEHSIALIRSGGVIVPTSMPNSAGAAINANPRVQPNNSGALAFTKSTIAQRRRSNGQQMMRSVIGPSGVPLSQNAAGIPTVTDLKLNLGDNSSSQSVETTMSGGGDPISQQMARTVNSNPLAPDPSPHIMNVVPSSMRLQPNRLRPSNLPLISPMGALHPTPRQSPTSPAPSPSHVLASSNPHAHPDPILHRSQTAPLTSSDPMGPPPRPAIQRTVSAIDGRDTTIYQGLLFCRGSSWRQVDVRKARICEECKAEKLSITKHRHSRFHLLSEKRGLREGEGIGWGGVMGAEGKKSGCMVCTEMATYGCDGCPLRLCVGCNVKLTMMCKGHLNNLIYMHGDRAHIRNDAFLLRSDGGGY